MMNLSMSSLESGIAAHNSFIVELRQFTDDKDNTRIIELIEDITKNYLLVDTMKTNFVINHEKFFNYHQELLNHALDKNGLNDPQFEPAYKFFLKIYLVKSNFRYAAQIFKRIFKYLSGKLETDTCSPSLFTSVLSLLHLLSGYNFYLANSKFLMFSGEESSGLTITFDNEKELFKPYLNREFSYLIYFTTDFSSMNRHDDQAYLLQFCAEVSEEETYSILYRSDKLWFTSKSHKPPLEFPIFENAYAILSKKWNFLVFSCSFEAKTNMTTIQFKLNEHSYKKTLPLLNIGQNSTKQKLNLFHNICGCLSTVCYFTRLLSEKDYKAINVPNFSQGITTSETFEHFYKVFEDDFQKSTLQLLLIPLFEGNNISKRESFMFEFIHKRQISLNEDCLIMENNANDYSFHIIGKRIHYTIFSLFNYITLPEHFKLLFKIVINFLSQDRIIDTLQGKLKTNFYSFFLSTLISTRAYLYFDSEHIDLLVNAVNSQNSKYRKRFFNKFLLNFQLLLHVLHTEEITKSFFNSIYKLINSDFALLCDVDVQNLIQNQLLFMHKDTLFENLKALHIAKIIVKVMNENHYTGNLDLMGYLLYINSPKENHTQIFYYLLNTISIHLKNLNYKVDNRELYVSCLGNFLIGVNYSLHVEKAIKLIKKLEPESEKLLIFLWRSKFAKENCLDTTLKIFGRYKESGFLLQSSLGLTKYLIKRVFDNLNIHNILSSDKIQLKKKGMFNLLFEYSLLLETQNIEKILQCFLVTIKKNPRDFVSQLKKTNFFIWNVTLLFMFHESQTNEALFDLANKLLIQYCMVLIQDESSVIFLNHVSDIVYFYSIEKSNPELKCFIISNILKALDSRDFIMENEEMLNSFIIYLFHYFYTNLRTDKKSESYTSLLMTVISYVHKNINLNPSTNLGLSMQKELTNSFSPKLNNSFAFWGLNSSGMKNMKIIRDTPLKYLTVMIISIFIDLNKTDNEEYLAANYRFINGYFDKLLHFLENNRSKLKSEKIYPIEVSLYHIFKEILKEEKAKLRIKEIKESLFYFSDSSVYPNSLAGKLLKSLGIEQEFIIDRFYTSMAAVHATKQIILDDYEDSDFNFNNESYALKALGEINQALEENQLSLPEKFFSESDIEKISPIKSSMYVKNLTSYKITMDALYIKQYIKLQKLFNDYYKFYKGERGVLGNLSDDCGNPRNFIEEFKIENFEYEPQNNGSLKFKHNPIILKNLERPFLKKKPHWRWKKPDYPEVFSLNSETQISNYFSLNTQFYSSCDLIHNLTFIPCFIGLRTMISKPRLEIFINFQQASLPKNLFVELKKYNFKKHKKLLYKYPLANIKEVRPYKFLQRRSAVLILQKNNEQIIVNFPNPEGAKQFEHQWFIFVKGPNYKKKDSRTIPELKFSNAKWLRNEMSNFKYLMKINMNSSRSYTDFSQYPIFPLIIKGFGKSMLSRELSLPIGMIGDEKRAKIFSDRFKSSDNFTEHPNYHYGSHYSSPATVFNFLIRLKPYEKGCKAIQSGHFDLPDRLFFSLKFMLKNIMEEMSDVRELIPEFYYLPEFLINLSNFDFGINQQQIRVHNVILPEAFKNSPYRFIYQLRQLLESYEVSSDLGSWIDLIFGYRQQGQEAIEAYNVFFHLTYEENVNKALKQDEANIHAIETQIYHFGQTPLQLFDKPHPNKKSGNREPSLSSIEVPVKYFTKIRDNIIRLKAPVIYMKEIQVTGLVESASTRKILLLKENNIEIWKLSVSSSNINPKNPFDFYLIEDIPMNKIQKQLVMNCHNPKFSHVVEVFGKSKIMYGGFQNGSLFIFNYSSGKILSKHPLHASMITHLLLDAKYNRLLSADISGVVIISHVDPEINSVVPQHFVYDYYKNQILSIGFCSTMKNLFYIRTRSGIDLRSTYYSDKSLSNIRMVSKPNNKQILQTVRGFKDVLVSFGYVNCFVVFLYHQKKNFLYSISFEGQIIGKYVIEEDNEPIFHKFFLVTDEYFKDHVIVCNRKGDLIILDLPFFEQGRRMNSNVNINVSSAILLNKNKTLLVVDDRGIIDIFSVISG